jgi:hypothetical protein
MNLSDPNRPYRHGRPVLSLLTVLILGGWLAAPASAHLSIVRQGRESRGSIEAGDRHGAAVALGDFNGDGFDDLASGAPGEDLDGVLKAGAVIVNYSNRLGVNHLGAQLLRQSDIGGGAEQPQAQFGHALAAGDFDADGYDDLAVASPYYDGGALVDSGTFWYYRGSSSGLQPVVSVNQSGASGTVEAGDLFGYSLAVGDFNSDGKDDLAVGSPGEDSNAGAVFQFTGSSFGPISGTWFKQSTLGGTNGSGDRFGWSVAAGNVLAAIGTQYDDLVVGAPLKDNTAVSSGGIWIIRGSSTGLTSSSPLYYTAGMFDSQQAGAGFGWAVAVGTFFGGTTAGVAIGEPLRDIGGATNAGRVIVSKGGSASLSLTRFQLTQSQLLETPETDDNLGYVLGAGHIGTINSDEDLFIGSPKERVGTTGDAGYASIVFGGPNGPNGSYGQYGLYQSNLGDPVGPGDDLGSSFASGVTDESGQSTVVIGAPGDDVNRGMVHVFAPWRQVIPPGTKSAAVWNCEDEYVYSQKPFDEVCIASTTKIMTVLIACERSQLPIGDPKRLGLNNQYVVPDWVRDHINGSRYEFRYRERITLGQLLYACLHPSGNDAAYAIADFLTGGDAVWTDRLTVVSDFVEEMNDRAAALGMTNTYFSNPAGLDLDGTHHSTAEDMLKLTRTAMENELFRAVAGDLSESWTTTYEDPPGTILSFTAGTWYGWLSNFRSWTSDANGAKPGRTPCALSTRCFAVRAGLGQNEVLAVTFGSDGGEEARGARLAEFGLAACGNPVTLVYQGTGQLGHMANVSTIDSMETTNLLAISSDEAGAVIDLFRQEGTGNTAARLELHRNQDLDFAPGETMSFGFRGGVEEQGELGVQNYGDLPATFEIGLPYQAAYLVTLDPGERHVIPPYTGGSVNTWTLRNATGATAGQPAFATVTEKYAWELSSIGVGSEPQFSTYLLRQGSADNLRLTIIGRDPNGGSQLYLAAHTGQTQSQVPDAPDGSNQPDAPRVTNVAAAPNPFTSSTRIAFTLREAGRVGLTLHDVQGRVVTTFEQEAGQAGTWAFQWSGRTDDGAEVPAGVYFYQVTVEGRPEATGKVLRVR